MKRATLIFTFVALVLGLSLVVPAVKAGVIIGLPADSFAGSCFPFGCGYSGEYQQVYTDSQFSGPMTIANLEFFNTASNNAATAMNSGIWTISLSTTSADWNTLSSAFASNIGSNNTQVFSGNLYRPWAFGDALTINLSKPFTYNPLQGNLLMDVYATGTSAAGGTIFFDINGAYISNTIIGEVFTFPGGGNGVIFGQGLVTGFNVAPVPIPGAILLFAPGLMGLAAIRRRSR
jgi:hypothetical protein